MLFTTALRALRTAIHPRHLAHIEAPICTRGMRTLAAQEKRLEEVRQTAEGPWGLRRASAR